MEASKIFKTKTGFCHVLPDKLVLTREGAVGEAAEKLIGTSIARPLIIYGLVAAFLLYNAFQSFSEKEYGITILFAGVSIWLLYGIGSSLNNSATPEIPRTAIQKVIFKPARPGLTRACFEVFFTESGVIRKRLIFLPGSLNDGPIETAKAVEMMKSEGLLH
ncbi:MAG: phosphoribosylaminoimidazolesuccinocarboxamide synthase [Hymenobacter sp.]|nr:MAG: phosphoribosylaminoimidazolesuccinocarboxamide synthase [Hymenobacter sp.]